MNVMAAAAVLVAVGFLGFSVGPSAGWAQPSREHDKSANYWLPICEERGQQANPHIEGAMCRAFVEGVLEGYSLAYRAQETFGDILEFCAPDSVTLGQVVRIFINHANQHPETTDLDMTIVLLGAMRSAFPCPD